MRTQRLASLTPAALIVVSCALSCISALVLVTTARGDNKVATCTSNTNSACATCPSTSQVYQCKPAALPTNCIYGTCPVTGSGPCGICAGQTCGNTDWNCADPAVSINGSTACDSQNPDTCSTVI
jgi:hypothetical protein